MRISDWSSDVCSSDLGSGRGPGGTWPSRTRWVWSRRARVTGVARRLGQRVGASAAVGDDHALVGGDDLADAAAARQLAGMGEDAVDGGVVMRGVVVEQRQALGPRLLGDGDRVLGRAVAPRRLRRDLLGGVLRVVAQQVDAVAQREHLVADLDRKSVV